MCLLAPSFCQALSLSELQNCLLSLPQQVFRFLRLQGLAKQFLVHRLVLDPQCFQLIESLAMVISQKLDFLEQCLVRFLE